eukprot:CAMPEP_0197500274 /NCGR_PEP_ID=MMETSP1311-20131121/61446_1 /TAXON_ID=464262 /ORGANISM="Genus nov. species nov., Strain RCC856" /LENGTH=170 /DNA_ID=CAMNT_0043046027 /DNA_START=308 /DNA_END=818 /DNA_ORIENTATION=+
MSVSLFNFPIFGRVYRQSSGLFWTCFGERPDFVEDLSPQEGVRDGAVVARVRGVVVVVPLKPDVTLWHYISLLQRLCRGRAAPGPCAGGALNLDALPLEREEALADHLVGLDGAHGDNDVARLERVRIPRDVLYQDDVAPLVEGRSHAGPLRVGEFDDVLVHVVEEGGGL